MPWFFVGWPWLTWQKRYGKGEGLLVFPPFTLTCSDLTGLCGALILFSSFFFLDFKACIMAELSLLIFCVSSCFGCILQHETICVCSGDLYTLDVT